MQISKGRKIEKERQRERERERERKGKKAFTTGNGKNWFCGVCW